MQTARQADPVGVTEAITAHQAELEHIAADESGDDGLFGRFGDGLEAHMDGLETTLEAAAITGLTDLDKALKMLPGNIIMVAGRPAMGKSAMTLGVALANAASGRPTLVHSIEMGKHEVTNRVLSSKSRVALHHLMGGGPAITDSNWTRIARRLPDLEAMPLWVDYTPRVTPGLVRTRIKSLIRQTGKAPLVIIDYVQLMHTDRRDPRQSTYDRVSEVSRELKISPRTPAPSSSAAPSSTAAPSTGRARSRRPPTCATPDSWNRTRAASSCSTARTLTRPRAPGPARATSSSARTATGQPARSPWPTSSTTAACAT